MVMSCSISYAKMIIRQKIFMCTSNTIVIDSIMQYMWYLARQDLVEQNKNCFAVFLSSKLRY